MSQQAEVTHVDAAQALIIDARAVIADALMAYAEQDAVLHADVALARVLAANVNGWTHTTRLREFLTSPATVDQVQVLLEGSIAEEAAVR